MEPEALLNAHQHKLHHLAQFLAAFGAGYLESREDDRHQSLRWDIENSALCSRELDQKYISLEYPGLMIFIHEGEKRHAFDPLGATFGDIESWIRETLSTMQLDPGKYKMDMGFTPTSPEDSFISLDNADEKILLQLTEERNIAQRALEAIKTTTDMGTSPIAVWPHHFDTAILLYPERDTKKKGFGLGYAPADHISEVPYFYAYSWSDGEINYDNLPKLSDGTWHIGEWKGAKIPVNQALDLKVITRFYREFISIMGNRV